MKPPKYLSLILSVLLISSAYLVLQQSIAPENKPESAIPESIIEGFDNQTKQPLVVDDTYHKNNTSAKLILNDTNTPVEFGNTIGEDSYVPNHSYEVGLDQLAADWTYQNDTSTKIYRDNSASYEGDYSYFTWSNKSTTSAYSEYFNVVSGGNYNASFYIKTSFPIAEAAEGYYVSLLAKNATSEKTIQWSALIKSTTDWTKYEYIWQIPPNYNYTEARVRVTMLLIDNLVKGASAWIDNIIIKPQIQSIICNQPFLLDSENLPSTLNFSAQFMNGTINPLIAVNSFTVKLDELKLTVKSVAYNETTQLYDITADLPALQNGKYMLKYGLWFTRILKLQRSKRLPIHRKFQLHSLD